MSLLFHSSADGVVHVRFVAMDAVMRMGTC